MITLNDSFASHLKKFLVVRLVRLGSFNLSLIVGTKVERLRQNVTNSTSLAINLSEGAARPQFRECYNLRILSYYDIFRKIYHIHVG